VWERWLRLRAEKLPYLWPNHRQAVEADFYGTGNSSVVVLPTGAGKTTISSLKIAGALARRKKVVFLAPTHALVEQLTEDLQEMFPQEVFGSVVSSDFDLLFLEDAIFQDIEVMTPERCLAMLSFAPEAFQDVGLLVFDECHLLSPQIGKDTQGSRRNALRSRLLPSQSGSGPIVSICHSAQRHGIFGVDPSPYGQA
jgi:replicative superfamily II helicase